MKVAVVEWNDAYSVDEWNELENVQKDNSHECVSVGMLMKNDSDSVILSLNKDISSDKISCVMVIPTCMVKSIKILDLDELMEMK